MLIFKIASRSRAVRSSGVSGNETSLGSTPPGLPIATATSRRHLQTGALKPAYLAPNRLNPRQTKTSCQISERCEPPEGANVRKVTARNCRGRTPRPASAKRLAARNLFQLLGLCSGAIAAVWATEHHALKTSQNTGLARNVG